MAQGQFDIFDLLLLPAFLVGMMANLSVGGVGSYEIPILGFALTEPLMTVGESTEFTPGFILALVSFAGTLVSNEWGLFGVDMIHNWAVIVTVIFIFSPPMIPLVGEVLLGPEATSIIALILVAGGYVTVSWLG